MTNAMHRKASGPAETLRQAARSKNTRLAYEKAWRRFASHCSARKILPEEAQPEDIANFFIWLGLDSANATGRKLSLGTLRIYRSAMNRRYTEIGIESPAAAVRVSEVLAGIARIRDDVPRRVKALREWEITEMLEKCPKSRFGKRDAAMLALGFSAALRRSELCTLLVTDLVFLRGDRMLVWVRRSKTDQAGKGQRIAVPNGEAIRPVSHVRAWLAGAAIRDGYVFQTFKKGGRPSGRPLNHSEVPRLVKKYAARIGLDPKDYSGHSLRAGFVTSAAAHGARLDKIMEVTRHRSPTVVLQYIRDANAFEDHAAAGFL